MKKIIILISLCFLSCNLFSQKNNKQEAINDIKAMENSKSGNLIDVFGGFYQIAFKNFDVKEKSLDLNATLFSIFKSGDADILETKSRKSIVFLRNFQINGKLNLNDKLNFNGYSIGVTWAIVNKRDTEFIILTNELDSHYTELDKLTSIAIDKIIKIEIKNRPMNDSESEKLIDDLEKVATSIRNNETVDSNLQRYYNDLESELDREINNSDYFTKLKSENKITFTNTKTLVTNLQESKNNFLKYLEKKPFLSISPNAITDKDGKLNQASAEMIFLTGSKFGEFDVRAKYNYLDTISPSNPRSNINAKIGYNFKILKNKSENKSLFEIKAYGEYNKILKNVLPNENEETILANADFRFRLTDDLWLPITVKYDTKTANFLGFLNVTYSFGI